MKGDYQNGDKSHFKKMNCFSGISIKFEKIELIRLGKTI